MKISIFLLYLGIILFYIILINVIAENIINFSLQNYSIISYNSYEIAQVVGVSDSVSIGVLRPRPYGKIIEIGDNSKLYLLNFIPLPLKYNGTNYEIYHLIFACLLIFYIHKTRQKEKLQSPTRKKPELFNDEGTSQQTRSNSQNIDNRMDKYNELPPLNF